MRIHGALIGARYSVNFQIVVNCYKWSVMSLVCVWDEAVFLLPCYTNCLSIIY